MHIFAVWNTSLSLIFSHYREKELCSQTLFFFVFHSLHVANQLDQFYVIAIKVPLQKDLLVNELAATENNE
jgi:hypothetical protein